MSYNPTTNSGVIVAIDKSEYEMLIRNAERIATVRRFMDEQGYISVTDIANILGIERKES